MMDSAHNKYDLVIIGGGINGVGIARDAAGRGYNVLLLEKDDLANHTSSSSSKLIHGGLRYLEYYEFKLVREALKERENLLKIAPHIIWPMRFVLPHNKAMRPVWMLRAGLFLYDRLAPRNRLDSSIAIDLLYNISGNALKSCYKKGFEYSDCWVQDARLVVLNAMSAADKGATILTHTQCVAGREKDNTWCLTLEDDAGQRSQVTTKMLVNATGPWAVNFLEHCLDISHQQSLRRVSGGHIVVPKMVEHDRAYIFQNNDKRIVFALPYEDDYTLIGTTERDVQAQTDVPMTAAEIDYLCCCVNRYFKKQISADDVVWQYTGVRALFADGTKDASATTREYILDMSTEKAACLSVFGGKITTYRSMAEKAMDLIDHQFGRQTQPWTAQQALPGGDFPNADFDLYLQHFKQQYPWLAARLAYYYVRNYGTRAMLLCGNATNDKELGEHFGGGLYAAEIHYLIEHEWAKNAQDILWRRSKWGLHLSSQQCQAVAQYMQHLNESMSM